MVTGVSHRAVYDAAAGELAHTMAINAAAIREQAARGFAGGELAEWGEQAVDRLRGQVSHQAAIESVVGRRPKAARVERTSSVLSRDIDVGSDAPTAQSPRACISAMNGIARSD